MRLPVWLPLLAALAGCNTSETGLQVPIPAGCEQQVYADPTVSEMIAKGAGSPGYQMTHLNALKYAKLNAITLCLQRQGKLPPGGGVERPAISN